jgi:LacI family gluconate utilization system Gnt-I transcriptional repressor
MGWQPAAVVVTGRRHSPGALQLLANAKAAGTPVIEVWDHHRPAPGSGRASFTQIGFNHAEVGRAMAEHLRQAGHRRLAYVGSAVAEDYRAHERGLAFAAAARAAGAAVTMMVAPSGDAFDAGRQVLAELAQAGPSPITAAAFANDHLACGALLEASARGVAVPQRLALLGFGDFAMARQLSPALSSVQLPRLAIGTETARSLLDALRHGTPAEPVSLPWTLVARGSTLPARERKAGRR